jgi:Sec-independent protein translocase protein TatA
MKLTDIVKELKATTGELKTMVGELQDEVIKDTKVDLEKLAEKAKDQITEKLLVLVTKLNR